MTTLVSNEFVRVASMLSGLTVSLPIMMMDRTRIERVDVEAATDQTLAALRRELRDKLRTITSPEHHMQMAQAYEAYSEAAFYLEMKDRNVLLERTPGTGRHGEKRPDFRHSRSSGDLYFEVKALEISEPLSRHKEIAYEALEIAADLDQRARKPGVHFGEPHEISGHLPTADTASRIDETIRKIRNNIKLEQIQFGATVLVVDLGRLSGIPQGASGLLPVFFNDGPPAESCVTGELWQIAVGLPGEQIFVLPEFEGKSNLDGHQIERGILREFTSLMGITFVQPRWSERPELLTIWNTRWDRSTLKNPCPLSEHEVEEVLKKYSDGLNDQRNELGWEYRVSSARRR